MYRKLKESTDIMLFLCFHVQNIYIGLSIEKYENMIV